MKNLIFILLLVIVGCKKNKPDEVTPTNKSGNLIIEYKTLDTEMTLYHRINNENPIAVKNIAGNYYKLDTIIPSGQAYAASISPDNGGYNSSILVKFEGDTLKYQTGTSFVVSGTCPVIE